MEVRMDVHDSAPSSGHTARWLVQRNRQAAGGQGTATEKAGPTSATWVARPSKSAIAAKGLLGRVSCFAWPFAAHGQAGACRRSKACLAVPPVSRRQVDQVIRCRSLRHLRRAQRRRASQGSSTVRTRLYGPGSPPFPSATYNNLPSGRTSIPSMPKNRASCPVPSRNPG